MEPVHVPPGYHLERRHHWAHRGDDRPAIMDDAGHVLAVVDMYLPDSDRIDRVELTERKR